MRIWCPCTYTVACLGFEQERGRFQSCIDRKGFGGCTVENRIIHSERVTIEDRFSRWLGTRQVDSTHTCVELVSCVTDMLSVISHQITSSSLSCLLFYYIKELKMYGLNFQASNSSVSKTMGVSPYCMSPL